MSDNIPFEMQREIMNKLPVKSLMNFRRVCKAWKCCIESMDFILDYGARVSSTCSLNLTYNQGPVGYMFSIDHAFSFNEINTKLTLPTLKPLGNCEGIWCFTYSCNMMALLWNPSIFRSVGIHIPMFTNETPSTKILFGFGVRPDTLDPTIIKITYPRHSHDIGWSVLVFTLSSLTWVVVSGNKLPRPSIKVKGYSQAVVNGLVFWVGYEKILNLNGTIGRRYLIVAFDLVSHVFTLYDIPDVTLNMLSTPFYVSNIGNLLVISAHVDNDEYRMLCAWKFVVAGSFLTVFSPLWYAIPTTEVTDLVGFTHEEYPIVQVYGTRTLSRCLHVYDKTTTQFRDLGIVGMAGSFYSAPHKDSLILLNHGNRARY